MTKPRTNKQLPFVSMRSRKADVMGKLGLLEIACIVVVSCAATVVPLSAQTFTTLARFNRTDGAQPMGALVQGFNGNFYGTAEFAGGRTAGTIFDITPAGMLTKLHGFCAQEECADGGFPHAGLVLATDGNFYGTTLSGGVKVVTASCPAGARGGSCGIFFKTDASGMFTKLYNFCSQANCADGGNPQATLVQAADHNFYGTTLTGGASTGPNCYYYYGSSGCGTVFKITPAGKLTTLYSFCSQTACADGADPSALVQATNANFYGTTSAGGATNNGTVFEITSAGKLTTLYNFCSQPQCADGSYGASSLIQTTNGNFYGTTAGGGANVNANLCAAGCGTIFEITPAGKLTTLYSFCAQTGCIDGSSPIAALVQATDGNFYGTTRLGGVNGYGTVFEVTPGGQLTTLYNFCAQINPEGNCNDGSIPVAPLIQATDGSFYGTTPSGGLQNLGACNHGCGTVFNLSVGLGPFVETVRTSGRVGGHVTVLGNSLTGATAVSFNGTTAFTVVSGTEITTTVPTGATTGPVQVVTPSGTLTSNVPFRVEP